MLFSNPFILFENTVGMRIEVYVTTGLVLMVLAFWWGCAITIFNGNDKENQMLFWGASWVFGLPIVLYILLFLPFYLIALIIKLINFF